MSEAPSVRGMCGFTCAITRSAASTAASTTSTDTPKLTVGHGGCFGCIYSVRGAGGYQMFGITPMPIYDPQQKIRYLRDFMVFFRPGDIVKWKPIDRAQYDATVADVEERGWRFDDGERRARSRTRSRFILSFSRETRVSASTAARRFCSSRILASMRAIFSRDCSTAASTR